MPNQMAAVTVRVMASSMPGRRSAVLVVDTDAAPAGQLVPVLDEPLDGGTVTGGRRPEPDHSRRPRPAVTFRRVALSRRHATLADAPGLLTDPHDRTALIRDAGTDPYLRSFWRWYEGLSEAGQASAAGPVFPLVP